MTLKLLREYLGRTQKMQKLVDLVGELPLAKSEDLYCVLNSATFKLDDLLGDWEGVLGWSKSDLLNFNFLDLIHIKDVDKARAIFAGSDTFKPEEDLTFRVKCHNGSYSCLSWKFYPKDNYALRYFLVRDVSEIKLLTSRLKFLDQDMTTFLSILAHDLKSPLSSIKNLLRFSTFEEEETEIKDLVFKNLGVISSIIDDLHTVSKLYKNTEKDVIVVKDLLEGIIKDYKETRGGTNLQIKLDPKLDGFVVHGNKFCITSALKNLVSNAFKFQFNTETPELEIQVCKVDGLRGLVFLDRGPGVKDNLKRQIFDPFYRIYPDISGTGIGLSIVAKVAKIHNGHVWVEDREGGGSAFFFLFGNGTKWLD